MNQTQLKDLILQSLEHEIGGIKVYKTALKCAINSDLKEEWEKYLEQTKDHERILRALCGAMELDADEEIPSRQVIKTVGQALLKAMESAMQTGNREAAQIVACEAVVLAETKDHFDWELIGQCAANADGRWAEALQQAYDEVEDQEDEHLYHTKGWARELWLQSLNIRAVLPPPEERKHVKSAIAAAKAEHNREQFN